MNKRILSVALLLAAFACTPTEKKDPLALDKANFETTIDGKTTQFFELTNANGMKVALSNYGARILSACVPDKDGKMADVILGFSSLEGYKTNEYNALIGPYANRINDGAFKIDSITYILSTADNGNCLHNGAVGFKHSIFNAVQNGNSVVMTINSADGEFGFPGNKTVKITYTLTDDNAIQMDYEATSDKACPFNLTNHAYFNLRGEGNGDILAHEMFIDADSTTVVNAELIPTGEIVSIKGTDMDFTTPTVIGNRINSDMEALKLGNGYDHNYILNKDQNGNAMTLAARVVEPESGRVLEVLTTEPAIQFYAGNFQDGTLTGKGGNKYAFRTGFCLETQHYPDSPNHANFPSTILNAGDTLKTTTIYKFSVK
ncbi:MAG: aldose epimerase family protein [Mangrovibacterium sp.]